MRRLKTAIKMFWFALRNPLMMNMNNFETLAGLFKLILEVAVNKQPYMCKIGIIDTQEPDKAIVSLWAGAGAGADPLNRIAELRAENDILRQQILELKGNLEK